MGRNGHYCFAWFITMLGTMMLWGQAAGAQSTTEVSWVDGADRYEVAVAAVGGSCSALAGPDGSVELALATGENWPDALAASALDRPLLLTPTASLHPAVRRLVDGCAGAVDVVILGGTSAVSQKVRDELVALGASVQRIKGGHRYETARKIAEFAAPGKVGLVYLATGANFADAISAAPRVTVSSPIVLTPKAALGPDASAFLSSRLTSNGQVVILGGKGAVSEAAEDDVRALGLNPRRIFGPDRYATSARTASESLKDPNCTTVEDIAVASGTDPYGGLVAASIRGPCEPMLLAPPPGQSVSADLTSFLQTWSATLNTSSTSSCRISMVGARATLGAQLLTDSANALQTAGCTPPPDNTDAPDALALNYAEVLHNDPEEFHLGALAVSVDDLNVAFVADGRDWWQRPSGTLTVNINVCAQKGLEHLFSQRDLDLVAESYNSYIAPFYSWQSSGRLQVTFKAGDIIASDETKSGRPFGTEVFAPSDCVAPYKMEAGIAQVFFVYGNGLFGNCSGVGVSGGSFSAVYVRHDPASSEPYRRFLAREDGEQRVDKRLRSSFWLADIVEQGLDFNIVGRFSDGSLHWSFGEGFAGPSAGRWSRQLTHPTANNPAVSHLGSLHGYPDIERLDIEFQGDHTDILSRLAGIHFTRGMTVHHVLGCFALWKHGWPMGGANPACRRLPPSEPQNVDFRRLANGDVQLTWDPPSPLTSPEPVTGYYITVVEALATGPGGFRWGSLFDDSIVATYDVDADVTSFTLPALRTDGTAYAAEVGPISAVGYGPPGLTDLLVFLSNVDVNVTQVQSGTGSYGIQLNWPAASGATSYKMTGIENCMRNAANDDGTTSSCFRGIYDTGVTLQHYDVVTGKSYDIEIFACNEGANLAPTDAPSGCYLYALATVDLRTSTVRLAHEGTSNAGFILRADWTPMSQSVEYEVWASLCQNDQAPCVPTETSPGFGYSSHSGTSSGRLLLDHGKRYWISVRACQPRTPEDPGFYRPNKCPVFADAWYTVPARSN